MRRFSIRRPGLWLTAALLLGLSSSANAFLCLKMFSGSNHQPVNMAYYGQYPHPAYHLPSIMPYPAQVPQRRKVTAQRTAPQPMWRPIKASRQMQYRY